MTDSAGITDQRHNDFVGDDSNINRIPGADQATSGHQYISVFPGAGHPKHPTTERRATERVPPPTGRDVPPNTGRMVPQPQFRAAQQPRQAEQQQQGFAPRIYMPDTNVVRNDDPYHQTDRAVEPLPPAPDSNTVIDPDPWAERPSAGDTLQGATSQQTNHSFGQHIYGEASSQLHNYNGKPRRKRNAQGLDQYGTGDEIFRPYEDKPNPRKR